MTANNELLESVGGRVIDFDNHYWEPEDAFSRHIEQKYRDLAFIPKGKDGERIWAMGDRTASFQPPGFSVDVTLPPGYAAGIFSGATNIDFADVVGDSREPVIGQSPTIRIADYPEWRDRDARLRVMNDQGVQTIIILPSAGMFLHHDFLDRPDALCANWRAFNRWLDEDWGFAGRDGRIFAVPVLTLIDLPWAIAELERIAECGSRFFVLQHAPVYGKSPADPSFDPFWSRVQEIGIRPIFHIGHEGFAHLYGAHWGEDPRRHVGEYSALQHYMCLGERPITDAIAALILHNLFGRFPGIQLISIENGSAWVAPLLRSLDKAAKIGMMSDWLGGRLTELPSEIFRRHIYVNPFHEEDVAGLVDTIGVEKVLFGSDYPHPEGLRNPLDYLVSLADKLQPDQTRKIMYDNAASLLGLSTASVETLTEGIIA